MLENATVPETLTVLFILLILGAIVYVLIKKTRVGMASAFVLAMLNLIAVHLFRQTLNPDAGVDALLVGYTILSTLVLIAKGAS